MSKKINVLILDDIEIIGDCICKRIFKANDSPFSSSNYEIIPHYMNIDLDKLDSSLKKITSEIIVNNVEILLLDRAFVKIIDPITDANYKHLNEKLLYYKQNERIWKIEEILGLIPKKNLKRINGVILYTYDSEGWYIEPAQIKQEIMKSLPERFDIDLINILLTNTEIYSLANLKLYDHKDIKNNSELKSIGNKSDFKLYGLFIGEILFHRIVSIIDKRNEKILESRKLKVRRNIIFLFIILTALNLGANALYNLLAKNFVNDSLLLFTSLVFALLLPLLILIIKPQWIINFNE